MYGIDDNADSKSAIMEPLDESSTFYEDNILRPDVINEADFKSITINLCNYDGPDHSTDRSFLLMDGNEKLHIDSPELFCKKLKCSPKAKLKVVTIFGNTGDGKSHTMNHVFFKGEEVFKTSAEQNCCTLGVYASLQAESGVLCLDTEGLHSTSSKHGKQGLRMLLKVLAISDIVIYRTRSERLHSELYDFLGKASNAFCSYFSHALKSVSMGPSNLGPAIIVFHETRHTIPWTDTFEESAEDVMRRKFGRLNYDIKAFSSLRYVGVRTSASERTDFSKLKFCLRCELENTAVRSRRPPSVIFNALNALNKKFSGEISQGSLNPFPEQYFTCTVICIACNRRCERFMGHDGDAHLCSQPCVHQHQLENLVELCKSCYKNGREVAVSRIDGWTHVYINCPHCGEIDRTFKYWHGIESCESVRTQIIHIWKDSNLLPKGPLHSGQIVLDKMSYMCETFSNMSAQPRETIKEWCADMVAPKYWKPNNDIIVCFGCKKNFQKTGLRKHHCRGCGEGFCDGCTRHRQPVPGRKWFDYVRVCNNCYEELKKDPHGIPERHQQTYNDNQNSRNHSAGPAATVQDDTEEVDVTARKCGETIYNTVTKVAVAAIECTKEIIKDTARPDYWVADAEAIRCHICKVLFGTAEALALDYVSSPSSQRPQKAFKGGDCKRHHCRKCGQGVCEECSLTRKPVPERGWMDDVRVCDECVNSNTPSASPSSPYSTDSSEVGHKSKAE